MSQQERIQKERELLEWAAKAAGYTIDPHQESGGAIVHDGKGNHFMWNPRHNNSDSMSLAIKLGIGFIVYHDQGIVRTIWPERAANRKLGSDPEAATREAVLFAAADIGKGPLHLRNDE